MAAAVSVGMAAVPSFGKESGETPGQAVFLSADGKVLNNIITPDNAAFEIKTSEKTEDGKAAVDGSYVTRATTGSYNGIPVFDVNGNSGNEYILLFTVSLKDKMPMEHIKLGYEYGTPYWNDTYYSNGGALYLGETVTPWPEGTDIYISDTGADGSWQKIYSKASMEGELLTEKRPEEIWDASDGLRTYYDFDLGARFEAKYVRIAVKAVKPWLGAINIPEIEIYGDVPPAAEEPSPQPNEGSLSVWSKTVDGGENVKRGTVPVITYTFNRSLGTADRSMVLIDGEKNSGLVQHAFIDALNDKKLHVVMYGDKLENNRSYTVSLSGGVKSAAGVPLTGLSEAVFTTAADYSEGTSYSDLPELNGTSESGSGRFYGIGEYDVYNERGSVWQQVPLVSQELRDKGISGGEGGQWLQAIECDTEDGQLLFAGVDIGGIVRSTDGGKTWERSGSGFSAKGCVDFEIDPNNKNRVLAVGSFGEVPENGIYLSEDMGKTWRQVLSYRFNGQRDTRKQLAWDKSSYDAEIGGSRIGYWSNLYRLTADNEGAGTEWTKPESDRKGGLYKTEDGGKTWFCVNEAMSDSVIEVNPNDGTVYAGNESGFFRSTDGGRTFTNIIGNEPVYGLEVINTRPDNVYINDSRGVLVSEDKGQSFTRINAVNFPVKTDLSDVRNITRDLAVSPANPNYMIVDARDYINYKSRIYYSHDGGATWNKAGYDTSKDFFYYHNRQHPFAWHPTDENKVWSFGGDWIASSSDGGKNFAWDANGYCGTPPGGRLTFNTYNPNLILLSAQDLFGAFSGDGGYTWEPFDLEESYGFKCAYGAIALDENVFVMAEAEGWGSERTLKVSRDGGKTFEGSLPLKYGTARRSTSFILSPSDPDTVFAGEYVSRDGAKTWTEMDGCYTVLAVNNYHNKEIYGIGHGSDWWEEIIVCSYDNGDTWYPFSKTYSDDMLVTREGTAETSPHMWDIEYDGINDILYYMQGNINTGSVLVKVENNVHKNISGNLAPQSRGGGRYMHVMAIDPHHTDILYVGTYGSGNTGVQAAVQRSCDRGESFCVISPMGHEESVVKDGPNAGAGVESLAVNPQTGELWAWTAAEGLWKFPPPYDVPDNVTEIRTAEDLKKIDADNSAGKYYKLMNDIDISEDGSGGWLEGPAVGNYDTENGGSYFRGTFDGNGHVIKNFTINCTQYGDNTHGAFGIFSAIGENAVIKNLGAENVTLRMGADYIYISSGAIAGAVIGNAKISGCYAKNVKCEQVYEKGQFNSSGGIAGIISGSKADGSGFYSAAVQNCYSLGFEKGKNICYSGGIAGSITSSSDVISGCYSDTSIGVCTSGLLPESGKLYYDDDMAAVWPGLYGDNTHGWGSAGYIGNRIDDVKTLTAEEAGDCFADDIKQINGGSPVLAWENERYKLSGAGTAPDPFIIASSADMGLFAADVEKTGNGGKGLYYKLTSDIDYEGGAPVTVGTDDRPFKGYFDGGGHTIGSYSVTLRGRRAEGLFGYVGGEAEIYNLGVMNVTAKLPSADETTWQTRFGAIAGEVRDGAQIHDCFAKNINLFSPHQTDGYFEAGSGIAGELKDRAKVYGCYTVGQKITGYVDGQGSVVGITRSPDVSIYNCCSDTPTVRYDPSNGEWNANLYDLYCPDTAEVPWPGPYYSTGKAMGYVVDVYGITEEEIKAVPQALSGAFKKDIYFINYGYPLLSWEDTGEELLSVVCTDKNGNTAEGFGSADMIKSVKITSNLREEAVLYTALYTDGILSGISLSETHGKAGEYDVSLPIGKADTVKIFLMNSLQEPLVKAKTYLLK